MISRRKFLKALVAGATFFSFGDVFASVNSDRVLNMHNVHTGESLNIRYCSFDGYDREALDRINYFLRCHYTNEVEEIDVNVLDLLCDINNAVNNKKEIQIISGYRSPAYNEYLFEHGHKVSRNSLHLKGLAIDFAMEGIGNNGLSNVAKSFSAGGVGTYPDFVHIDVGRVRYW
jgi:uncharacterized protein YcbK (DUF882 family)